MEPLPEMVKSAGDKIADSESSRHAQPLRASTTTLRTDAHSLPRRIVRLDRSGRYFFCPSCKRSHRHPHDNLEFYMIGYALCGFNLRWMPIEGGDELGIICVDERGRLYTVERGTCARQDSCD